MTRILMLLRGDLRGVRGEQRLQLRAAGAAVGAGLEDGADRLDARHLAASDGADDGVDADVEAGADDRTAVLLRHAGTAGEEHRRGVGLEGGDHVGAGDLDRLGERRRARR